jgi:hypothetical protein
MEEPNQGWCSFRSPLPVCTVFPFARVYSTCLFCNQSLGSNEVVEAFPVGRRLAFDQRRGRLWVVCRKCEKWNLTPLEERWEAIETCERFFRDAKKRVSTDNIGLAKLNEGLELVRIGEPQLPEFAAWRYGDQFGRRRRRLWARSMAGGVAYVAFMNLGAAAGFAGVALWSSWILGNAGLGMIRGRRIVTRVPDDAGGQEDVRLRQLRKMSLVPGTGSGEWGLRLLSSKETGELVLIGEEARRVAARLVPLMNSLGANRNETARAVAQLEEARSPESYLAWAARNPASYWKRTVFWLATEMALNEENERQALEVELAHLEDAWKEAEEIASIADRLSLPRDVDHKLAKLKADL